MSDKKLADLVVAFGVGAESTPHENVIDGFYMIEETDEDPWMYPDRFVRDWRVAGALMEMKVRGHGYAIERDDNGVLSINADDLCKREQCKYSHFVRVIVETLVSEDE